jgi:hypothetical protein
MAHPVQERIPLQSHDFGCCLTRHDIVIGPGRNGFHRMGFRVLIWLGLALHLGACGDEDEWIAFDVRYAAVQDCSQVGANAVQCADVEALTQNVYGGRWIYDYTGSNTLTLITDTGRFLPGIYFQNDGRLSTVVCLGGGGTCHFARSRTESTDPQTGCLRTIERRVDVVLEAEELVGEIVEETTSDESCGTANIRQLIFEVTGSRVTEAVLARQEETP